MKLEKIKYLYQKNKERVIFRWNKLIVYLRGCVIDIKVMFFLPQLNRFFHSFLHKTQTYKLRIGISKEGGIGDLLILGAFATAVKRKFPYSHITAITNNNCKSILERNHAIDKIRVTKLLHRNKVVKDNCRRYDVFYELCFVPKVFVNTSSLNGYKKAVDNIFKGYSNEYDKCGGHTMPDALGGMNKNQLDFYCECTCLKGGQRDLKIKLVKEDQKFAETLPFSRYVTIKNGGFRGGGTKNWPSDNWMQLVEKINEIGLSAVQLGTESEELIDGSYDLRGKTTIYEAAAVTKRGLIHIDTEGGLAFLAKAVNKRSIVLFGPTPPSYFGLNENINIRTKAKICEPCNWKPGWLWKCHLGYKGCKAMEDITPEDVFQEVVRVINLLKGQNNYTDKKYVA